MMKSILLVSSSDALLERNYNLLMRRGFQMFEARTAAEALRIHREQSLNLVVADLQLEDMGGDVLCSRMRIEGACRDVAVLLICHDLEDHVRRVGRCSANGMLLRPISPVQLMEMVGRFLAVEMVRCKRVDFRVKVEVAHREAGLAFCCLSHDISRSGIRLESEYLLDPGSRIACRFPIPAGGTVEAEGQVVRHLKTASGGNQYGVQFVDLPVASRRQIESHVNGSTMII
jgi:DNA-binding response OmpR family regulator